MVKNGVRRPLSPWKALVMAAPPGKNARGEGRLRAAWPGGCR